MNFLKITFDGQSSIFKGNFYVFRPESAHVNVEAVDIASAFMRGG